MFDGNFIFADSKFHWIAIQYIMYKHTYRYRYTVCVYSVFTIKNC